MATVYSLICWGGLTGKSVTGATATDIITSTNHGLRTGTALVAQSTVSGVTSGTTYYVNAIAASTFYLYDTLANAQAGGATGRVDITATTAFYLKSKIMLDYMTAYPTRWGAVGSERIYDGLASWNTARASGYSQFNNEVCELGMAFDDITSTTTTISFKAPSLLIHPYVDGTKTNAASNGVLGGGYCVFCTSTNPNNTAVAMSWYNQVFDGFSIKTNGCGGLATGKTGVIARRMVLWNTASTGTGIDLGQTLSKAHYNVITGFSVGIVCGRYAFGIEAFNNTVVKNATYGFYIQYGASEIYGFFYNNISLGNGTNWFTEYSSIEGASHNYGASGDANPPWAVGSGTTGTVATTDFASWGGATPAATDDYSPALSTSPQVDNALSLYGALDMDVAGGEVPSYNNGGSEAVDVGAYEYDLGYGPHPQTQSVTVSGIASGSRIKIAKQSDGTEIYNSTTAPSAYTTSYSTATPVYIYARKGSAATYYHPLKLSATIDPDAGLTYDATGLQQEDIAAHDYSATAVATDWTFNSGTGAITHASGSTRYSVQDLYSWHQDYYDDSATVDDLPLMHGTTSTIFELINSGTITDSDLEDLFGGSIEFGNGDLWSNLWTTDTMAAAHDVYVVQGTSKYTAFWSAGPIDVLLQVSDAGTLRSSGLVDVYARPYGYTYAYYRADLSAGGRTVAPIATLADSAITETSATVAGWTDITVTFSTYSLDFGDGDGSLTYYCRIDCNGRPLSEVYQRMQYLTRSDSSATLNGVEGWRYQSAHTGYDANSLAPFGTYSGGVWTLAKGVWLDNVPSGDLTNYIVTDDSGATHQNTVALNQSVTITGVTAGSRVQIYDTTNATELFNDTTGPYSWEDPSAPAGDRTIRVRITYVSGATAKEMIEANIGTCGTSASTKDVTYLAAQVDDAVYVANAVDGSAVTGLTINDSTNRYELNRTGGAVTWAQLYAYHVYSLNTEAGIRDDFSFMEAVDVANYLITDYQLKNVTSPSVPCVITGGFGRDADSGTIVDIIDTTGGMIFPLVDHVVSSVVTVTGGNVITGDIADITFPSVPTETAIADAVWAKTLP